jgi:hypothetical protein
MHCWLSDVENSDAAIRLWNSVQSSMYSVSLRERQLGLADKVIDCIGNGYWLRIQAMYITETLKRFFANLLLMGISP